MILNIYILCTLACLFSIAESRASRRHNGTDFILKFFQTDPFLESLQKNSHLSFFQVNSSLLSLQMNYFVVSLQVDSLLESLQMDSSLESLDESYPVLTTTLTSSFVRAQCNAHTIFKQIHHDLYSFYFSLTLAPLTYLIHTRARFVRMKRLLKPSHFKAESPTILSSILSFLGCGNVFSLRPFLPRNVASLHVQTAPFKLGNPPQFILPALLTHYISYSPLRQ